jgi:hypothetical protein
MNKPLSKLPFIALVFFAYGPSRCTSARGGYNVPSSPVANAITSVTTEDTPVFINVLANDSDPSRGTLTLTGVTQWAHGTVAVAPAVTSAVQVSSGQEINAGSVLAYDKNQPWTIMAGIDVAHNPASVAMIASNLVGSGSAHPGYQLWIDPSGHLRLRLVSNFSAGNYIEVQSGFVVTDGNWHEVAVSYDGSGSASRIKFYLDGAQDTATKILNNSLTGSIVSSTHGPLIVGNQAGYESTYDLNGSLDQFSISNVLRSQTYIAQHSLAGSVIPVDANTVLAYNFSEAGGTIAHDLSSNGYSATLSSSSMWTVGPRATLTSAVQVSSGQEINAGSVLAYDKNQPWTIMAGIDVAHNPTEAAVIFTNVNAVPYPGYELWIDPSGHLRVRIISNFLTGNYIDVQGSVVVTDGKWHEVAASYNGSSFASGVKIYVAGVLDTATTTLVNSLTGSIVSSTHGPLIVGNQAGYESTFDLNGSLDQFSISNVVRSQAYIAEHSLAGSVIPVDANTVLAYNFSEAGGTIAHDLSSNGYSATLSSSSMWTQGPSYDPAAFRHRRYSDT